MYHLLAKSYDKVKDEIIDIEEAIRILKEDTDIRFSDQSIPIIALNQRLRELKAELERIGKELDGEV